MGKGDKKTRRGKIIMGSYGRLRPRKKSVVATTSTKPVAKPAPEKITEEKTSAEETKEE